MHVLVYAALFILAFAGGSYFEAQSSISPDPTPTPTITSPYYIPVTPVPTWTPVPTKYVVKSTIDPDPPVHCPISAECGGGTNPLRKSECDLSTCCQIGDKWIFYKDRDQCIRDQGRQTTVNNPITQLEEQKKDFENWMNNLNNSTSAQPTLASQNTQPINVYVIPTTDPAIIKKCIDNINADFKAKRASCSYFGGGSASFQCEESYRRQAEAAKFNCK